MIIAYNKKTGLIVAISEGMNKYSNPDIVQKDTTLTQSELDTIKSGDYHTYYKRGKVSFQKRQDRERREKIAALVDSIQSKGQPSKEDVLELAKLIK